MSLVICGGCNRHVRRVESRCPFCNAEIPLALAQSAERPLPTRRLSRGALITFAAATFGAACGGKDTDSSGRRIGDPNGGGMDGAGGVTASGGASGTSGIPVGGFTPAYGTPFDGFGGFPRSSGGFPGSGGVVNPPPPPYGLPPPPPTGGHSGFDTGGTTSSGGRTASGGSAHDAGPSEPDATADAATKD